MTVSTPATLIAPADLTALRDEWERGGARVAFVPTMGALHEGHLSLVKKAKSLADRVVVSIFVNPIQFGPSEDFEKYPRTMKADLDLLTPFGVDAVFLPNAASMYPDGFETFVTNRGDAAKGLCGAARPGHFDGVLTVVLKLFNLVRPHTAIFGKKDYQQWRLIETMARDLGLKVEVIGSDTLREADGLAMSSRNRYLSPGERLIALRISKGLFAARDVVREGQGAATAEAALDAFRRIAADGLELRLEYSEVRRQRDLAPLVGALKDPAVMIVAARVGATRLIDNLELE